MVALQVLSPNGKYAGQVPISPVVSGTSPSQPQLPMAPSHAAAIRAIPTSTRSTRSMEPTFFSMVFLLEASRSCEAVGRRSLTWINEAAAPGQGGRLA